MRGKPESVLILGSGGLRIGQAGEFDYSGSQALKALRSEGARTILVNPNIATVQTSDGMADSLYLAPVDAPTVSRIIERERPDGILLGFGGQTALDVGLELWELGVLERFGVDVLGTPLEAVRDSEDRERFVMRLSEAGVVTARSSACRSVAEAVEAGRALGFPVMVRSAYSLGGLGSGIASDEASLSSLAASALRLVRQILVEECLGGWKEIEYEVVRDRADNCIAVCNMENLDPMGIHTGESIVVAPSQTLSDREYQMLRSVALRTVRHLGIVGECNIQFALDPRGGGYRVIEVNARLSRSSALASKATGYPLAAVAAHLAMGRTLPELVNRVTGTTRACFEPAMDYVVVKAPRWDLERFRRVDDRIGSQMKSVGEVMAIARGFEEALQKSLRMTGTGMRGLVGNGLEFADLRRELAEPTPRRIFAVAEALRSGMAVSEAAELTSIDPWFLERMAAIVAAGRALETSNGMPGPDLMAEAKRLGFSDEQIARACGSDERSVRIARTAMGIVPCVKQIDTLAAEYPASTNYLYTTYNAASGDVEPLAGTVLVLGGGAYRIGSSVEFDWCCVNAAAAARSLGYLTTMLNCNPETVSTDFDVCDRLYFDEISAERILDIVGFENPEGVIVSMGGQEPNNLVQALHSQGVRILGTSPDSIDRAEDRNRFSALLDELGVDQPEWTKASSIDDAAAFAARVGFPVIIRPSYVLSGASMAVVWDDAGMREYLTRATGVDTEAPVVVSKFVENAREVEFDGVASDGSVLLYAIGEHVENAGVHSGDATVVMPPQRLYVETARQVKAIASRIARALRITGPFNIQFLARDNRVRVIECNLRASRTFPFSSKVMGRNFIDLATRAILGERVERVEASALDLDRVGVKAAQFSFQRLTGADPAMGVAMASTGEVACIGEDMHEALLAAMRSVGFVIGRRSALISTGPLMEKAQWLPVLDRLRSMGFEFYATSGTARFMRASGFETGTLRWPLEGGRPNCIDHIREGRIGLVINIPKNNEAEELSNDYLIRRAAVDCGVPLLTNLNLARRLFEALSFRDMDDLPVEPYRGVR